MSWFADLFMKPSAAQAVLVLGLVTAVGLAIGSVRIRSVSLGIAGVLFAGILFGHFHVKPDEHVLEFAREFGLILFVYTIGLQVGPGFFAALKRQGLALNAIAFCIATLGLLIAIAFHKFAHLPIPAAAGLFAGATTNTPALAGAQQALGDLLKFGTAQAGETTATLAAGSPMIALTADAATSLSKMPGLAYAVAYPFGVLGIILSMMFFRVAFRVDVPKEASDYLKSHGPASVKLGRINLEVTNPNLEGLAIEKLPMWGESGVVVSRVMHGRQMQVATAETVLHVGDVLHAVGPKDKLDDFRLIVGVDTDLDLTTLPSEITTRRIVVTQNKVIGKEIAGLDVLKRHSVTITRVSRAEIEFVPTEDFELQFGDTVLAVGEADSIQKVSEALGNSLRRLNHPQLIPVFFGIVLGIILGSIPFHLPGIPAPVKLGLAGGPLLAAILLSRLGRLGPLNYYMPISANFMLREVGISLFLACVGLRAGDQFVATLTQGDGLRWMAFGAVITVVPLVTVGLVARLFLKLNFTALCGLLAGSMTDPPALAFAVSSAGSEAPSVAYATVYPLTMILRVLYAQVLVLAFAHSLVG